MPYITVGHENSASIDLYYEDHGSGAPVVLIHGYPLSGKAWDKQVPALLDAGYRVIAYDRRGFGKSSQPTSGYDYDTFAADLEILMNELDLRDATIVGHSMGTGEVTRYLGACGSARVAGGVLVSPIPPFLLQTGDNPEGVPASVFDGFTRSAKADLPAWMKAFLNNFFSTGSGRDTGVSDEAFQANWNLAITASAAGTVECIPTWETDFRADLEKIDVPLLVIQGDADQVLPFEKTGNRVGEFNDDVQVVVVKNGSHAIPWTHSDQVTNALVQFIGAHAQSVAR
jgi:non-heme chloroperoxidase